MTETPTDNDNDSAEQLRRLQSVTDAALSSLDVEDLLVELLARTRQLLHADTAVVLLMDSTRTVLVATAAIGLEEEVRRGVRLPIGQGFAGTIAATGEPLALEHVDHTNVLNPILLDKHVASVLGVPMISAGIIVGVLHVGSLTPRRFTDDDVNLLKLVADRASLATEARRSRLDRAATLALQRSLLPARVPSVSGLDVAARYVPGAEVGVGGDWYDLFALPSGHIGVAIGDIAGSGLRAAVVMGRIRSALRAYALETTDPADVLSRLDRKIQLFEPDAMATVLYAVIDPTLSTVTMSSAGHLPPAIASSAEPTRLIPIEPDLPLGAYSGATRRNTEVTFRTDDCLFFYTDGLVERRGRSIKDGIDLLLGALTCGPAEPICHAAMATLFPDTAAAADDVAILAVRRTDVSV